MSTFSTASPIPLYVGSCGWYIEFDTKNPDTKLPEDLTGATLTIQWRTPDLVVSTSRVATIVGDPTLGNARYLVLPADFAEEGIHVVHFDPVKNMGAWRPIGAAKHFIVQPLFERITGS